MGPSSPRPVCFMVTPFGKKAVDPPPASGPSTIDFDALWDKAFAPVIDELGYEPVRADREVGALIIQEMLERLYFSDLVVADMTIPNGNVYYEVGIRHASQRHGCVLVSADWTRPLFDVDQMRRLTYPLPEGVITDETARGVREALKSGTHSLARGHSPMFQALPGFPEKVDSQRAGVIRSRMGELSAFQVRLGKTRVTRDKARRRDLALAIVEEHPPETVLSQAIALELVSLIRDCVGWPEMIAYVDRLPEAARQLDVLQEQRSLGISKTGEHEEAISALRELVRIGDSSERQGLLGGRYKKLADEVQKTDPDAYRDYLDQAIEHYERGMHLDLNDYYPSCNLPALYRERDDEGDAEKAAFTWQLAWAARQRARERNPDDEWVRPTLLTLLFFKGDVVAARSTLKEMRREGPARWKVETTLESLERSVRQTEDPAAREALQAVLAELKGATGPKPSS